MSEAKHTPGPWGYRKGGQVLAANGRLVASAWFPEQMPDTQEQREPGESWLDASRRLRPEVDRIHAQMEKNARLISAAPELLEALKNILASVDFGTAAVLAPLVAEARAAIAKATGEQA